MGFDTNEFLMDRYRQQANTTIEVPNLTTGDAEVQAANDSIYREPTGTWGKIKSTASVPWNTIERGLRKITPTYALDMLLGGAKGLEYLGKEFIVDPLKTAGKVGGDLYGGIWNDITGQDTQSTFDKEYQDALAEGGDAAKEYRKETLWDLGSLAPIGGLIGKAGKAGITAAKAGSKGLIKSGFKGAFTGGQKFNNIAAPFGEAIMKFKLPQTLLRNKPYQTTVGVLNKTIFNPKFGAGKLTGATIKGFEKSMSKIYNLPFSQFVTNPLGKAALKTAFFAEMGIKHGDIIGRGGTEDQKRIAEEAAQLIPSEEARFIQNPVVNMVADIGLGSGIGIPYLDDIASGYKKLINISRTNKLFNKELAKGVKGVSQSAKFGDEVAVASIDRYLDATYDIKLIDKWKVRDAMRGRIYNSLTELGKPVTVESLNDLNLTFNKVPEELVGGGMADFSDAGIYVDGVTNKVFGKADKTKHFINSIYENVQGKTTTSKVGNVFDDMNVRLANDMVTPDELPGEQFKYLKNNPKAGEGRVRNIPVNPVGGEPSTIAKKFAGLRETDVGGYLPGMGRRSDSELYADALANFRNRVGSDKTLAPKINSILQETELQYRANPTVSMGGVSAFGKTTLQDLFIKDWKIIAKKAGLGEGMGETLRNIARQSFADLSAKYVGMKPWMMNQLRKNEFVNKAAVTGRVGRFSLKGMFHVQQQFEDLPYIAADADKITDPLMRKAFMKVGFQNMDDFPEGELEAMEQLFRGGKLNLEGLQGVGETSKISNRLRYEVAKRIKGTQARWVVEMNDELAKMPVIQDMMKTNGYKNVSEIPEWGKILDDIAKNPQGISKYIKKFKPAEAIDILDDASGVPSIGEKGVR